MQMHYAILPDHRHLRALGRKSMALTGMVILVTVVPGGKCTSPNEPGKGLPSLLGTSTSVFRVRVAGIDRVRGANHRAFEFLSGKFLQRDYAFTPTFIAGA